MRRKNINVDNDNVALDAQVNDNVDALDKEVHDDDVQHSPLFCSDKFSLL